MNYTPHLNLLSSPSINMLVLGVCSDRMINSSASISIDSPVNPSVSDFVSDPISDLVSDPASDHVSDLVSALIGSLVGLSVSSSIGHFAVDIMIDPLLLVQDSAICRWSADRGVESNTKGRDV